MSTAESRKLATLRRENERHRLVLENAALSVAATAAEKQAQRSAMSAQFREEWGDYISPWEYLDFGEPSYGLGGTSQPIYTTRIDDRLDGSFAPAYRNMQELDLQRAQARNLAQFTSTRWGVMESLACYVLGNGFKFKAVAEDESLAAACQDILDEFIAENDFTGDFDNELHNRSREDGEFLCKLVETGRGIADPVIMEPEQLLPPTNTRDLDARFSPDRPSSWTYGVHTELSRPHKPLGYHFVLSGDGRGEYVPACHVLHVKRNVSRKAKRGVSDYWPVMTDITNEWKLRRNSIEGESVRAGIAGIIQHATGTTESKVESMVDAMKVGTMTVPTSTGSTRSVPVVKHGPGEFVHTPRGMEWMNGPTGNSRTSSQVEIAGCALRSIGVRWSMPEYMISADASNANFASTLVAESPFVKARERDQSFYGREQKNLLWKVMKIAWQTGRLDSLNRSWQQIERELDIEAEAPKVASRNQAEMATTMEAQIRMGILSRRTAATQAGLDYDAELEGDAKPEAPPSPFGGLPGMMESVRTPGEARRLLGGRYP